MVLNGENCEDFGKIKLRLMKLILMVGFSGILVTGWVEDWKMIKDKLTDRKRNYKYSKEKAPEYYLQNKEAIK